MTPKVTHTRLREGRRSFSIKLRTRVRLGEKGACEKRREREREKREKREKRDKRERDRGAPGYDSAPSYDASIQGHPREKRERERNHHSKVPAGSNEPQNGFGRSDHVEVLSQLRPLRSRNGISQLGIQ